MPIDKSSILQRSALLSGLVSKEQLEDALAAARQPAMGPPAPRVQVTDEQLARQLVTMGLVTQYQAEQLKAGRTKLTLGPYLVTDWVAQGGMGQVFKAEHQLMGREVAIKVLPHSRSTPAAVANFTREIRTQAILDHENLVRAYDAGHDGNVYYLVTEYVRGSDLRRVVRSNGPLSMSQAASVIVQAARGLQSAHEKGLIHRDIKPGNILVTTDGKAKISDLGLAGFLQNAEDDPQAHKIVGTADFISPEQIKTPEQVTPVGDIYSLGCTLYYAVTGKVPFPGGSTRDKARCHCEETPWHPRRFNPDVSEEFVEVIADMMEKNPAQRIQTAADVITRLESWTVGALPLAAQQPTRSPWMPPPVPGPGQADEDLQATQEGSYDSVDFGSQPLSGSGQISQSTDPFASSQQETRGERSSRRPPVIPMAQEFDPQQSDINPVVLALAIGVPIAMLLGALLTLVVLSLTL